MNRVKSELSSRNPTRISKHRYYELRHWCLQYPEWKAALLRINYLSSASVLTPEDRTTDPKRRTEELAAETAILDRKIGLLDRIAEEAGGDISKWLKIGITEDKSFTELKMLHMIPCERDLYYRRYRLFFALLSDEKTE